MAATTEAEWTAIWTVAGIVAPDALGTPNEVKGRSITSKTNALADFWSEHQDTLIPFLTQLAIAALNALLAARGDINAVNPPGPD